MFKLYAPYKGGVALLALSVGALIVHLYVYIYASLSSSATCATSFYIHLLLFLSMHLVLEDLVAYALKPPPREVLNNLSFTQFKQIHPIWCACYHFFFLASASRKAAFSCAPISGLPIYGSVGFLASRMASALSLKLTRVFG